MGKASVWFLGQAGGRLELHGGLGGVGCGCGCREIQQNLSGGKVDFVLVAWFFD